jgi:DNA-binding LacI/PurR family transcriptional regulator
VRTSHYDAGRIAAEALLDQMTGRAPRPGRLVIEPQLVVRASCGAAGAAGATGVVTAHADA